MPGYDSIHKGNIIDAAVSAVIAGKAGIQGVLVNGSEVEPDPDTNKLDITVPTLLSSTGSSTTAGMTQSAITTELSSKADSSSLSAVATSGDYDDLSNKPTIPTLLSTTGSSTTDGMTQSAITTELSGKATVSKYTATLSTSWDGISAPYTQTVSVSGVLSTDNPIVDVVLSSTTETAISQLEGWGCVSKIETSNGSITATCLEEKPTVSIPIQMCVVR